MYGAILGDMIGSPYEFDMGDKTKEFPLFSDRSTFTDDTVMTLAVAEAFMRAQALNIKHFEHGWYVSSEEIPENVIHKQLVESMQRYGKQYPNAGYGGMFLRWLSDTDPKPYGSYGNGSAMRVSSVAWLFDDLGLVRLMARLSAEVTHNHPEGIKGAEATASAIFLARTGHSKEEIKTYIENQFGYNLSRTCDEIRSNYHHVESCQETVPEATTAFLEGESLRM